jgi:hypothetical protein
VSWPDPHDRLADSGSRRSAEEIEVRTDGLVPPMMAAGRPLSSMNGVRGHGR